MYSWGSPTQTTSSCGRTCGSLSDASVFNDSTLEPSLREETLGLPAPDCLPNDNQNTLHFLMSDDAFPLRKYLIKPYSHRYFQLPHIPRQEVSWERIWDTCHALPMPVDPFTDQAGQCYFDNQGLCHFAPNHATEISKPTECRPGQWKARRADNTRSLERPSHDAQNSNHQACSPWDPWREATSHGTQVLLLQRGW